MIVVINGVELDATFTYYPAYRGYRNSFGAPEEPDEPETIEIEKVEWKGLDITDLIANWDKMDEVEAAIWANSEEGEY